jgi:L-amino acid N-acyltransferase YncA
MIPRDATEQDLPQILEIYNDVIANSTAIYTEARSSLGDRVEWFNARKRRGYPVLVVQSGTKVAGFASLGEFRAWPGYYYTVEHSVHVHSELRGRGFGRLLLQETISRAEGLGKHVLVAGIDAGNVASLNLHLKLGFETVGRFKEVGRKFGRWLDLIFMQRKLISHSRLI